jgi:hypothetical protein
MAESPILTTATAPRRPTLVMVSDKIEREAVQVVECTIPVDMTLDEWRRNRPRAPRRRPRVRRNRTPDAPRHLSLVHSVSSSPAPLGPLEPLAA